MITTVAWNVNDPLLVCSAHANNVRLIAGAPGDMPLSGDSSVRSAWIQATISSIKALHLDGLTFDYESPIAKTDPEREWYTQIVQETTIALHNALPGSQVSVCVAWSSDNIDGRDYDWVGLANASDLLYQMVYDTRSQIFDRCIASANSPLPVLISGLNRFISVGVPVEKMVVGIPWYGYDYPCVGGAYEDKFCEIKSVPFRGVNCSDAAGGEVPFYLIMPILDTCNTTSTQNKQQCTLGRQWDWSTSSPYFNYVDSTTTPPTRHQIWYDDVESLSVKYRAARSMGAKGVGPFMYEFLDPSGTKSGRGDKAKNEALAMWNAIKTDFLQK